jgi:hypothetical protein
LGIRKTVSTEINLTTSSDEGENIYYLFHSSKPFSSIKDKLEKSSYAIAIHLLGSECHCQQ